MTKNFEIARISSVHRDQYSILGNYGEVFAEITGKLLYEAQNLIDKPLVGDKVEVEYFNNNELAIIHQIKKRTTILKRKTAGKKIDYQGIAANIDYAFIVQALEADFNLNRLERYLVMINEAHIVPIIILSKKDLLTKEQQDAILEELENRVKDYQIVLFSNKNGENLDQIRKLLKKDKTYCLLGSSGVGKSTLLNNLLGAEIFATKEIREKDGKGKHATTKRQMIKLKNGALIIDTPGMRELGNIDIKEGLNITYDEVTTFAKDCLFNNCTHTHEKKCGVLAAVENKKLSQKRYDNYIKLRKEATYHSMSYLDKRRKDKNFGKMIKRVLKNTVKNHRR
ncbi:ribosome small subunit-dependent GTPase A [bacterium]|jgi:ribosome biogenesis GTPase / thiamine phosphate phosphatase|nr:ribosome small subunit-dependent GTPase A [bacterium]